MGRTYLVFTSILLFSVSPSLGQYMSRSYKRAVGIWWSFVLAPSRAQVRSLNALRHVSKSSVSHARRRS